jgi:hypothetical protein
VTPDQAKSFLMSILRGDPNRFAYLKHAAADVLEAYRPHKG